MSLGKLSKNFDWDMLFSILSSKKVSLQSAHFASAVLLSYTY